MHEIERLISEIGIIPVIAIDDVADALPLANALRCGGLPAAEITFRTSAAAEAIERISSTYPDVLVGAGTVLNITQCQQALEAGAKFIVSPGYNPELVAYCLKKDVPVFPGCVNASDMTRAVNDGLSIVKFFPAEPSGGVAFLKAMAPVFPKLRFLPTGGVNAKNLADYLSFGRVIACGGTWMVKKDLIAEKQWDTIAQLCRQAVAAMLGLSLAHVGINCGSEAQALDTAQALATLLGFPCHPGRSSAYAGTSVECTYAPGPGTCGHIAFATANVARAVYHLSRQGVRFNEGSRKLDSAGNTRVIYLEGEIGGFAIHLVQK